jgi:hypothetical protein
LVLVYLLTRTKVEGPVPKSFSEAYQAFREARTWGQRGFIVFLCTLLLFRESYKLLLAIVSVFSFVGLIVICSPPEALPQLREVRDILRLIYQIFHK